MNDQTGSKNPTGEPSWRECIDGSFGGSEITERVLAYARKRSDWKTTWFPMIQRSFASACEAMSQLRDLAISDGADVNPRGVPNPGAGGMGGMEQDRAMVGQPLTNQREFDRAFAAASEGNRKAMADIRATPQETIDSWKSGRQFDPSRGY